VLYCFGYKPPKKHSGQSLFNGWGECTENGDWITAPSTLLRTGFAGMTRRNIEQGISNDEVVRWPDPSAALGMTPAGRHFLKRGLTLAEYSDT